MEMRNARSNSLVLVPLASAHMHSISLHIISRFSGFSVGTMTSLARCRLHRQRLLLYAPHIMLRIVFVTVYRWVLVDSPISIDTKP
jgi:hypothetical protein